MQKYAQTTIFSGIYDVISYDVTSALAFKNQDGPGKICGRTKFRMGFTKKKRIISYKITLALYWLISKLISRKCKIFSFRKKKYGHTNGHQK